MDKTAETQAILCIDGVEFMDIIKETPSVRGIFVVICVKAI